MGNEITTTEPQRALTLAETSYALSQRQAAMFATSPLVPEHLRKGGKEQAVANCWIALKMAEAMGEQPLTVMQNIQVIKGKAGFAAQYMIARANSSGIFKGRINWHVDRSDPNNLTVTAFATLKDTDERVEFAVDMAMARAEGWTSNPKYKSMPELMLRYRSATFLVRFYAPDVMLGYQTIEEVEDVTIAAKPASEPLTAEMLVDQSKPAEEVIEAKQVEETPHDPETGEVQEGVEDTTEADDSGPGTAEAITIIGEIEAAKDLKAVDAVAKKHKPTVDQLPDDLAKQVKDAAATRRTQLQPAKDPDLLDTPA